MISEAIRYRYFIPTFLLILLFVLQTNHGYSQTLPQEYKFTLGIRYAVGGEGKSSKKGIQEVKLWYGSDGYSGIEADLRKNSSFMIYDLKDMSMVILTEAQKAAMIIDIKAFSRSVGIPDNDVENDKNVKVSKTGKTEKILGYTCEQYKIISNDSDVLVWMTTELGSGFEGLSKAFAIALKTKSKSVGFPDTKDVANGIILKAEITDLSNRSINTIEATEIFPGGKIISTSGYKLMSLPMGHGK